MSSVTILAVSGPSGAGKSTIADLLGRRFGQSARIAYDDYYRAEGVWNCDYAAWVLSGSDPDGYIRIPRLVGDLNALRAGNVVKTPVGSEIEPAPLVILEEPWGRQRTEIESLIDFVAHIDVPLDVALARKLLREAEVGHDTIGFLREYLEQKRWCLYAAQQRSAESADCVVDGLLQPDHIVDEVVGSFQRFML